MSVWDRVQEWAGRLLGTFRRRDGELGLDEELRFHLEMETGENLRRGMDRDEAARSARLRLGGIEQIKERYRDQRGLPALEVLWQDLRYGLRTLRRDRPFAVVTVLSLAIGIGANAAIFSLVDASLLRELPVDDPERLVFIASNVRGISVDDVPTAKLFSYPRYTDLRDRGGVFEDLAAFGSFDWTVYMRDGEAPPEPVSARLVSGNYFEVLGVRPFLGQRIESEHDRQRGGHPICLLGHGYWRRRFGADREIVGRTLTVNDQALVVIGVAPPEFQGETVGSAADLFLPLAMQEVVHRERYLLEDRETSFLLLVGRLKQGVSIERANAEVNISFRQNVASEMGENPTEPERAFLDKLHVEVVPGDRGLSGFRQRYGQALLLLTAAIGLVLLIACANIANLLLVRAQKRQREMGVRLSLGAWRGRLLRQLLTECLILALAGGMMGLLFAHWGSRVLLIMVSPGSTVVPIDVRIDHRVLLFTFAISLMTAVLFGLVPALRSTRVDIASFFHFGSRTTEGSSRFGLSRSLVVFQVALSLLLLIGAGLFLRSLENLRHLDLGFGPDTLMVAEIDPEGAGMTRDEGLGLYERIQEELEAIPGVRSASLSFRPLLSSARRNTSVEVEGYIFQQDESDTVNIMYVTERYFETTGMILKRGRRFESRDRRGSAPVAIVNESFQRRFFADRSPVGASLTIGDDDSQNPLKREIIGVVGDARYYKIPETPPEMVFLPALQSREYLESVDILTDAGVQVSADQVRQALTRLSPRLPVLHIVPMTERVAENLTQENTLAQVTGAFGLVAVLLAASGLYGVMSWSVSRRTNEIGIRMALGAPREHVVRDVLLESLPLVGWGFVLGLAAAVVCAGFVESLLYGVSGTDWQTFGLAAAALSLAAFAAAFVPAYRASRVDPSVALRFE